MIAGKETFNALLVDYGSIKHFYINVSACKMVIIHTSLKIVLFF